jgi:maleylacetoacetate isomerase
MKLYTYWRSSAAFRVRIALNLKGIAVEQLPRHLRNAEHGGQDYLRVNPQGLVPALDIGGEVLSQSLAIIEYLEETRPQPALLPPDPLARAQVRSMAMAIACDLHPLNNLRVQKYLKLPLGHDQPTIDVWCRHWVEQCFVGLEQQLKRHSGDGRHCFGNSLTLADVCLVPQVYNARRIHCALGSYPTLTGICAALEKLPAFMAAAPEQQPDAE